MFFLANLRCCCGVPAQREVLLGTQLYKPMALIWHSAISVSGKGGEKTGENDLDSDTSLVHSQLRVRGDVSPGQYHSTVVAIALCPINRFV